MTFKTHTLNNRELAIGGVRVIREEDGMLIFYPYNNEQCAIFVDGVIVMRSDKPSIDIRCVAGDMKIMQ